MKQLKKHPKQQRMEDMTFPITKPKVKQPRSYKMYQRVLDRCAGGSVTFPGSKFPTKKVKGLYRATYGDVNTPELGSKLTLDKLEAMEKDMRKGFKNGDLTATEAAERSRERIIKKGTRIMVDKGVLGTDTGVFISTNGCSIGGFYGRYLSDKDNKEHIWDQTVHNITAIKEYEKQNDKVPHTREYLRPICIPHHERHLLIKLLLVLAVIYCLIVVL